MSRNKKIFIQALAATLVIVIGIAGFKKLKSIKQGIEKQKPEIAWPLVRTVTVTTGPLAVVITGQGTVMPDKEIQLVPQVSGQITKMADNLVNGGFFKRGDLLLTIDPADYEIAVTLAEARVREAESAFQTAEETAAAAIVEWQRHNPETPPPSLVAKIPQTKAARAKLAAERASLEAARLNLERTRLNAPFNGRVVAEAIDIGQYVTPGQSLATLQSTEAAEIVIPLADADLFWIDVPGFTTRSAMGAAAEVTAMVAGKKNQWPARVVRSEGRIDNTTRMHNIVVSVEGPYASFPPLAAGQFAEVRIFGKTLDHAAIIPRAALHSEDTVWLIDPENNRLLFKKVDVVRFDQTGVVIRDSLTDGDRIVTSPLKTVTHGMTVRLAENPQGNAS